jgi:hypothetical protein
MFWLLMFCIAMFIAACLLLLGSYAASTGDTIAAGIVAVRRPVPVHHVGATVEAGVGLDILTELDDPFDPRWEPVVWEPPTVFDAMLVLAPLPAELDDMSFTGQWARPLVDVS